jgi:hypothetical protein
MEHIQVRNAGDINQGVMQAVVPEPLLQIRHCAFATRARVRLHTRRRHEGVASEATTVTTILTIVVVIAIAIVVIVMVRVRIRVGKGGLTPSSGLQGAVVLCSAVRGKGVVCAWSGERRADHDAPRCERADAARCGRRVEHRE